MIDWSVLPPLTALRALAALAQTGDTARAGAVLNVSHAAISQQLRALEDHLSLNLIDRSGRSLALTPDGQMLADAVTEGLGGIARTVAALTGQDEARPLMITATPAFAATWLMPRLPDFQIRHPGLSLMLDPTPLLKEFRPGGIDVGIRHGTGDWVGLKSELLVETPIAIVAAPGVVEKRDTYAPADLVDFPWLQELGTSEASQFLSRHGVDTAVPKRLTHLPGNLMLDAARNGQGIAVIARAFVEPDLTAGRLQLLYEDRRMKGYFIVYREGALRPAARAFVSWLRKQAAQHPQDIDTVT
ncbi:MAG: LysR family transcriptional regulator [Pseudomonadota bacterium]|nr:LysR family transcriptional regulator [Pseudomonadota bacterium]